METGRGFNKYHIQQQIYNKNRSGASEMIVQEFLNRNSVYTLRYDLKSEVWIYKNGIYIPEGITYIKEFVREVLDYLFTKQMCNDVIAKIEADTYISDSDFFIGEDPKYIAVENGILDLFKKELLPFTPKKFFFQKIPVKYNPKAKSDFIEMFFKEVLYEKDINTIQELFGFLLYRDYKFEKAFMFSGGGRNGKGKTVELMKRFLGASCCANVSLQRMESDRFAISGLHNKLANLSADLSYSALKETGTFKSLTGHDLISAARKHKTDIDFTNYAKMIFCANEIPRTSDITLAFFNRWILIDFPYTFLLKNDYEKRKNERNIKLADKEIINKISKPEQLEGLLNWALEGLERLFKNNDFSASKTTDDVKNSWIKKSDSFTAFCIECLENDWNGEITKEDLEKYYSIYCKQNKIRRFSDKHIKITLQREFGATERRESFEDRKWVWVGVKIKKEIIDFVNKQINDSVKNIRITMEED